MPSRPPRVSVSGFFQLPREQIEDSHRVCLRATDVSARAEGGRSFLWEGGNERGKPAKGL